MIKSKQELSIVRQCKLLDIHRSGVYHRPRPSSTINLALMREIDEIHLNRPFLGVRRVTDELCEKGHEINHKRIHRLMQIMGIEAIYPKPNTSKSNPAHQIQISMDGRGAWRDNVFVERLWRSIKFEEVYLNAYESMAEAKSDIATGLNTITTPANTRLWGRLQN